MKSAIRDGLEGDEALTQALSGGKLRVKRFPRKNDFSYKVVPFKLDAGWRQVVRICCFVLITTFLAAFCCRDVVSCATLAADLHVVLDKQYRVLASTGLSRFSWDVWCPRRQSS